MPYSSQHALAFFHTAAVGVVHQGKVVFQGGYGSADLRKKTPVDPDTAFHLASCGKEMTAVAILLLVQDGKLRLDDRAVRYLPELRGWGPFAPRVRSQTRVVSALLR